MIYMKPILQGRTVSLPADATLTVGVVPISDIGLPDNHCGMDLAQVGVYTDMIRAGHRLEPVLLLEDGDRFWLIDGRHRFVAAVVAGHSSIEAFITSALNMVVWPSG